MDTGMIVTILLAIAITFMFVLSAKRVMKKFTTGDCCGSSGCSSCNCHCNSGESKK